MQILLSPEDLKTYRHEAHIFGNCLKEIRKFLLDAKHPIQSKTIRNTWRGIIESAFGKVSFPFMKQQNLLGESFPYSICISVNECVAHGIGSEVIDLGDSVTIDAGIATPAKREGRLLNYDSAVSCILGNTREEPDEMITSFEALRSIASLPKSNPVLYPRNLSASIYNKLSSSTTTAITSLSGHCIGYKMHQLPGIPNAVYNGQGYEPLVPNMLINPEPMASFHKQKYPAHTWIDSDGWSVFAEKPTSHWESTFLYDGTTLQDIVGITEIQLEGEKNESYRSQNYEKV